MKEWTKEDVNRAYNINKWGDGYFDISEKGSLTISPNKDNIKIDFLDVVEEIKSQGIKFPAVIRFHDILESKIREINETFKKVIEEAQYKGKFMGVYPIKVNQMREVVEEIVDAGAPYNYGLEAGSKAELLAVLAYNTNENSITIANGYKDEDFLKLALLGNKLGREFIIVVEKISEIDKILKISKSMDVRPMLGIRAKMVVEGKGRWAHSSGKKAKFGLNTLEIIQAVEKLKKHNMDDCIKLFHFHIGSQVSDIKTLKDAIYEGGRTYSELIKMGLNIKYFDVGGGLGVDYDGSRSTNESSTNYSLDEYVSDIVWGLKERCDSDNVPHPNIITESGRAITAHHSCVITNIVEHINSDITKYSYNSDDIKHKLVYDMIEQKELLNDNNYQEVYNDIVQLNNEGFNAFKLGIISLKERAIIEDVYRQILNKIKDILQTQNFIPEELQSLESDISPQYLCNLSVFQSAADMWAIRQLLPIMPISRLNEKPNKNCSLVDITCDSDGKIDKFIHSDGIKSTIPLHEIKEDEEYLIGLFLTGAYQDVMGDMHNLFGRLNEVHIFSDASDPKGFYIEEVIDGNSASDVLSTMQYNTSYMEQTIKKIINNRVAKNKINPRIGVQLSDFYSSCLKSYTYLKN